MWLILVSPTTSREFMMGAIRKAASISTFGLVSWKSNREKKADALKQQAKADMIRAKSEAKLNEAHARGVQQG